MRAILLVAILLSVGCGGTEPAAIVQPPPAPTAIGCETNLDAGTPCDPCPGATIQRQFENPQGTARICGCGDADGGLGAYMQWESCPATATCAHLRAFWNDLCHR